MSGIRGLFLLEVSCCSEWVFEVIGREILSSETLFPGRLRQCSQNTSKSSVRPPIFQGPNGCTPARFLSGCGPEVVQKSASGRSPGISFLDRESVGEVGLPPHCRLFTNLL